MLNLKKKLKQQKHSFTTINSLIKAIQLIFTLIRVMVLEDPPSQYFLGKIFYRSYFLLKRNLMNIGAWCYNKLQKLMRLNMHPSVQRLVNFYNI